MPQVVASYFISTFALTGIKALVVDFVVNAAFMWAADRFLYRKQRPNIPDVTIPLNSRRQYLTEQNPSQQIIYGTAVVAPTIIAAYSNDKMLNILCAVCPHALENDVLEVRVNEQDFLSEDELDLFNANGSLYVGNDSANDDISELRAEANRRSREASLPIVYMMKDFTAPNPGNFHTKSRTIGQNAGTERPEFGIDRGIHPANLNMRCSGMSWIYMQFPRSKRARDASNKDPDVWGAIPTITFKVRRPNSSLKLPAGFDADSYANGNTALCAYDYLARYTEYRNPLYNTPRIDEASFRAAALFCERQQSGANPIARNYALACNGTVNLETAPAETLDQLGLAMNSGCFPEHAGIRHFAAGSPSSVTQTISDDDIIKDSWNYNLLSPVENRVSQYIVRFADGDGTDQSEGALYDTSATTASSELQLDLVNNSDQAQAVARILLSRVWNGASITFELNRSDLQIKPYDKIRLRNAGGPLMLDEIFRVISMERGNRGGMILQCQYEDPNLFEFVPNNPTYIPPSRIPNYRISGTHRILLNGTQNRLLVRGLGASENSFLNYQ